MSNESHIQGNENIVIQRITDSTITININGHLSEISNSLSAFLEEMKKFNAQLINYAGKTLNLQEANDADLNALLGKKNFNELLIKATFEAIVPYNPQAKRIWQEISSKPQWETQSASVKRATGTLINGFVGPIGLQLRSLFAIGADTSLNDKLSSYITQCISIAKRSLELVVFTLISKLWDEQKERPRHLSTVQLEGMERWFKKTVEHSIQEQFEVLKMLHELFTDASFGLDFPLSELGSADFVQALQPGSPLTQALAELESLDSTAHYAPFLPAHCYDAERHLATFLQTFAFLAGYRMASIRKIDFHHMRIDRPSYLHRFEYLSPGKQETVYTEKFNYAPPSVHTNAVLLYQGKDYHESINLSPFVIDYNMLTLEENAKSKIYFYQSQAIEDCGLEYLFLEGEDKQTIGSCNVYTHGKTNLDELDINEEKRVKLIQDFVVEQFRDAYCCLLGQEFEFEFDNY